MKINKLLLMSVALVMASLLSACGSSADKFVGKWQNTKRANDVMAIKKNGDTFLIEGDGKQIPATLQNGTLVVPFGSTTVTLVYVEDSDTLLLNSPMAALDPSFTGTYKRF